MTIKPKRESVRQAAAPGPKQQATSPAPHHPVEYDGTAAVMPPSFQDLAEYHAAAEPKLSTFVTLVNRLRKILRSGKAEEVAEAKNLLTTFDSSIPVLHRSPR